MKVLVWLEHRIAAFSVQPAQLATLARCHPRLELQVVRSEAELLSALPEAEAALVWSFSADWYARGPKLRFVATPAAGRENLEADPSERVRAVHGHFHGKIMAESLLAMILFFSRRVDGAVADQAAERYDRLAYSGTRRLAGQQALIVGYGPLGRECARLLKALGMRVVGLKRNPDVDPAPADRVFSITQLHEQLGQADHVILTLPSDTGTDQLIGARELSLLHPSASLYNIGRGNAVDEQALVRALESEQLAHAFLDVFEQEPLPAGSRLWKTKNLVVMPHASAISREYLDLWFEELAAELDG